MQTKGSYLIVLVARNEDLHEDDVEESAYETTGRANATKNDSVPPIGSSHETFGQHPMTVPSHQILPRYMQRPMNGRYVVGEYSRSSSHIHGGFAQDLSYRAPMKTSRSEQRTHRSSIRLQMEYPIPPGPLYTETDFNNWIESLKNYLKQIGRGQIVPGQDGVAERRPSHEEVWWLELYFNTRVPEQYCPSWIKEGIESGIPIIILLMRAFATKAIVAADAAQLTLELTKHTYNGKGEPMLYLAKVEDILSRLQEKGHTYSESEKGRFLASGLKGEYSHIRTKVEMGQIENDTVSILNEMQIIYKAKLRSRRNDESKRKQQTIKCNICHLENHVTKYCDQKPYKDRQDKALYNKSKKDSTSKRDQKTKPRYRATANYVHALDTQHVAEEDSEPEICDESPLRLPDFAH